jgi:hypothetical protein
VGADRQWAFFHERSPKWLKAVRTGLFVYALARFGWFAVLDASGSAADEGPPLGLFSAFGMVIYLTVAMVLRVALKDARLVPHSAESS